jgi:hypothetical protein
MWTTAKFTVTISKCKSDVPTLHLPRKQGINNIIFILRSTPHIRNQTTLPVTDIDYYFLETSITRQPTFTEAFVRDIRDFRCPFSTRTYFYLCCHPSWIGRYIYRTHLQLYGTLNIYNP